MRTIGSDKEVKVLVIVLTSNYDAGILQMAVQMKKEFEKMFGEAILFAPDQAKLSNWDGIVTYQRRNSLLPFTKIYSSISIRINRYNPSFVYVCDSNLITARIVMGLSKDLVMFFTGFTRFSSEMQKANAVGYAEKQAQLKQMYALVDDAEKVLEDKYCDLDDFGRLLDKTWRLKRQTGSAITTNSIDSLYEKGIKAGALGGKLLGAGGGGFLVFYVQPERKADVMEAMLCSAGQWLW